MYEINLLYGWVLISLSPVSESSSSMSERWVLRKARWVNSEDWVRGDEEEQEEIGKEENMNQGARSSGKMLLPTEPL